MTALVLAVGDGALEFWRAIRDVFPDTKEQRRWWHKIGNVLAASPKSAHPAAKKALTSLASRPEYSGTHTNRPVIRHIGDPTSL